MSVIIRGMDMPENCWDCPCSHDLWCNVCGKDVSHVTEYGNEARDEDCPLFPVPEHGRLIDADEFTALMFADPYQDFVHIIEQMPTIIPEDKEEQP